MNAHVRNPGGVSVGQLKDQPVFEACIITYLRFWADGDAGQARVQQMLQELCGPARGGALFTRWVELFRLLAQFRRRTLMRHTPNCPCLGADEACFATFMATAATGAREDALMMATLLVRPDIAPVFTDLAQQVGLSIMQGIARHDAEHLQSTSAVQPTLH